MHSIPKKQTNCAKSPTKALQQAIQSGVRMPPPLNTPPTFLPLKKQRTCVD
jgi:hypothetical protein